ncbi:MAG: hypothetical protein P9M15_06465, partial [Candidatus Electryoneaceae bacterium]|nr:hypothetical protein [Candidatus Electryoneaceae bacterium]
MKTSRPTMNIQSKFLSLPSYLLLFLLILAGFGYAQDTGELPDDPTQIAPEEILPDTTQPETPELLPDNTSSVPDTLENINPEPAEAERDTTEVEEEFDDVRDELPQPESEGVSGVTEQPGNTEPIQVGENTEDNTTKTFESESVEEATETPEVESETPEIELVAFDATEIDSNLYNVGLQYLPAETRSIWLSSLALDLSDENAESRAYLHEGGVAISELGRLVMSFDGLPPEPGQPKYIKYSQVR